MAEKSKSKFSFLQLGEYGSGMFAMSFNQIIIGYYYLFFLTDIAKMEPKMAASLYTTSTAIKIIAMILPGTFIDTTFKKQGTYRTWYKIGSIGCFLFTGLMFLKLPVSDGVYFVYSIVMLFLGNLFYNFAWISSRALIGKMSTSADDTTALVVAADWGTKIAGLITGYGMVWAIAAFAKSSQQYLFAEYLMSIFMIIVLPIFLAVTKPFEKVGEEAVAVKEEVKEVKVEEKTDRADMLRSFTRPAIMYYIAATFGCAQVSVFSALMVYYTKYVLRNDAAMGTATTLYNAAAFVGLLITPWLRKHFSNRLLYGGITLLCSVVYVTLLWIRDNSFLFIVNRIIVGIIITPTSPVMVALATDVSDYNEMKGKSKARGFVTSMMGVTIRLGLLLASSVSSFLLAAAGYDARQGEPSPEVLNTILLLMAVGPAVCCVIVALAMVFYNVDEKELNAWRAQKLEATK